MAPLLYKNQRIELDVLSVKLNFKWINRDKHLVDICLSAFLTNAAGEMPSKHFFVFFGNTKSPDSSVLRIEKSGQCQDSLCVHLQQISSGISKVHIVATLRNDRNQNFAQARDFYFEIEDCTSGEKIASYFFFGTFISETAIEIGTLFKEDGRWHFHFSDKRYETDLVFFLIKHYPRTLI